MNRAKTVKKGKTTINYSGPQQPQLPQSAEDPLIIKLKTTSLDFLSSVEKGFDDFFASENKTTLRKPWIKLDRALKTDRIKEFVLDYKEVTPEERQRLLVALSAANERGSLKSRLVVNYNSQTCKIDEIKGLTENQTENGKTFRLEPPRATKRRSKTTPSATTAS